MHADINERRPVFAGAEQIHRFIAKRGKSGESA
jgi:hypothetical protein